jgi:dephospho-CoA kinase
MSNWPGKYVIGLTGNIATGKSVVRKMLEHLGAYGIDADALAHRAIARGAPGYQPVVSTFGQWILDSHGEVDRTKLGKLVFSDPDALQKLEGIVHPLVEQAVDLLIRHASQPVIVVEAIKLLEGKLANAFDTIWVSDSTEALQKSRLMHKRHLSEQEAVLRIHSQADQQKKKNVANLVIRNTGSFEETWKQVLAAWKELAVTVPGESVVSPEAATEGFSIKRGGPHDSAEIADFITRMHKGSPALTRDDIMGAFGEKAFLLLYQDKKLVGIAGWQVENLVTRVTDLFIDEGVPIDKAVKLLIEEVERASHDLQCEASLVFSPENLPIQEFIWTGLGYAKRNPGTLGVRAWQDAALESQQPNTRLFFKQLRQDRVLRPI